MSRIPTLRLLNGVEMPQLGLGTWPMNDAEAAQAVRQALEIGYRLVDTAENYRNETGVGEGVRRSGVPRNEVFLTTKLNREWHSRTGVRTACEASLARLGTDYVDLLLIHWPNPAQDRYVEAFESMAGLLEAGLVRAIGVSNFKPDHLAKLFSAGLVPHVNQIQLDPTLRRDDLVALHRSKGIVTESWSPLGMKGGVIDHATVTEIASHHGRTPGQIVLRWHVQSGFATPPKSSQLERQKANLDVFSFNLTEPEMTQLNAMPQLESNLTDADRFGH